MSRFNRRFLTCIALCHIAISIILTLILQPWFIFKVYVFMFEQGRQRKLVKAEKSQVEFYSLGHLKDWRRH